MTDFATSLAERVGGKADPRIVAMLGSREWRLNNLYHITDKEGRIMRFSMNLEQRELFNNMHYRNEILKARQLGISTFVAILMLDCCLFRANFNAGIIDKTLREAKAKLEKVYLAYDLLDYQPERPTDKERALAAIGAELKRTVGITTRATEKAVWNNRSAMAVGTDMRGGTLQMLHVSELAYVANHNPIQAKKIQTGALQAVATNCVVIKESTHEGGRAGLNYEMVIKAMANKAKKKLSPLDYRFFFFSWHGNPQYELDAEYWTETPDPSNKELMHERRKLEEYFAELEKDGIRLNDRKKAWYQTQYRSLGFAVRQEFPSTPDEAFDVMAERGIYVNQILRLKAAGRWSADFEADPLAPFYVSWDIGLSDYMCMWLIQAVPGGRYQVLDHYSANNQQLQHYIGKVRAWEAQYFCKPHHLLPHDASNRHPGGGSFEEALQHAGLVTTVIPRTQDIWRGIQSVRMLLPKCIFHENCGIELDVEGKKYPSGLQCLENYQTAPDGNNGTLRTQPLHDRYSHSCDAFRIFAEAEDAGYIGRDDYMQTPQEMTPQRAVGCGWLD